MAQADDATKATTPSGESSSSIKNWLLPLLVMALIQFGAPFVPIPNLAVVLVGITVATFVYVGGVVAFSLGIARKQLPLPQLIAGFVLSTAVFGALQIVPRFPFAYVIQSFSLLILGTFLGLVVSRMIRHANMLGPIGVMVAIIDIWGVLFGGIVAQLLTNKATKNVANVAMAHGPRLGAAHSKYFLALPDVGIGDYLFLALFLGIIVRFGMNWRTSAIWMWLLVSVALLSITLQLPIPVPTSIIPFSYHWVPTLALPGLLFLGAGAVLPNLKYFQFTREERFALLYAGIFVVILTVGLYFGFTSMLPKDPASAASKQSAAMLPKHP